MIYALGSLFTGIGGIDLGFIQTGQFDVRFQVEIDPFCRKVLTHHSATCWPNSRLFKDVKNVGRHNLSTVAILAGGFPCQDLSSAGKRAGIREGENSPVLLARFDPESYSWKTLMKSLPLLNEMEQRSTLLPSLMFLETCPRWGMTLNGELWQLPTLALHTNESAGFAWPTPVNSDDVHRELTRWVETSTGSIRYVNEQGVQSFARLSQVAQWSTPTQTNARQGAKSTSNSGTPLLTMEVNQNWSTPNASDYRSPSMPESKRIERKIRQGWSIDLRDQVVGSGLPRATPTASAHKGAAQFGSKSHQHDMEHGNLKGQVQAIGNPIYLNPDWEEQCLMGFPADWTNMEVPSRGLRPAPYPNGTMSRRALYLTTERGQTVFKQLVMLCACLSSEL